MMPIRSRKTGEVYREGQQSRGLQCPKCACHHFSVVYTRHKEDDRIERRRECRHCGYRVTTSETIVID